ncbi:efflux RND transporter periplasmic adaptor subunit [Taurinivorans muris]|uniref:Efflux RND transporter periplasmic adaptor subunit n=1 Tax=Taurinivorans muris TaxID=2787751 RepID=A0ABY5XYF0_9BACT|nr:efflux RND transporter periplasmic adaptor subunit [Desulfovibrionaceae bacterium LT0009]
MKNRRTIFIVIGIFLAMFAVSWFFMATKPVSMRKRAETTRFAVNVLEVSVGEAPVQIRALGTIRPYQETNINARVSSQVVFLSENSDIGAIVKKDEVLVKLDADTYVNTLRLKKSDLAKAKAAYELEMGQQSVAKAEAEQLKQLSSSFIGEVIISDLALRAPQLAQAKADVEAAEAAVKMAQLDVDYTTIKAPYNSMVTERNVSVGSLTNTQDNLMTLVGIDEYRIEAAVAIDKLTSLNLKKNANSKVQITTSTGVVREGRIIRHVASLDSATRMGRILISIPDPLGIKNNAPALILGDHAEVVFKAGTLENSVIVPRRALQPNDSVFVAMPVTQNKDDGSDEDGVQYVLDIREVDIAWKDLDNVYIRSGLENSEYVITSVIPTAIQGMPLTISNIVKNS